MIRLYTKIDDMRARRIVSRIQSAPDAPTRDVRFAQLDALLDRLGVYAMATRSSRMSPSASLSVARVAVWKAAMRYDPTRSASFIAYALMKARYDIRKARTAASSHRMVVHVPRDVMARYNRAVAGIIDAELAVGHAPDASEAAAHGVDAADYRLYDALRRFEAAARAVVVDDAADVDAVVDADDVIDVLASHDLLGADAADDAYETMTARAARRMMRRREREAVA